MDVRERMMHLEDEQVRKARDRGKSAVEIITLEPHLAESVRRVFSDAPEAENNEYRTVVPAEAAIEIAAHAAAHGTSVKGIEGTRRFNVEIHGTTLAKEMAHFEAVRLKKAKR